MSQEHYLQCKHIVLSTMEARRMLKEEGIDFEDLPHLWDNDPAIADIAKVGDIVKIIRPDLGFGEGIYYRRIVSHW